MEAEKAGSSGLATGVSWPCIGRRTSFPSVVKSNVAFLNTGGSSRLAVHTTVLSAPPARKIPTAYPLPCGWNPKAYRPEGDSHDKFEPSIRKEPRREKEWRTELSFSDSSCLNWRQRRADVTRVAQRDGHLSASSTHVPLLHL
ncbi:hypothetical protein RJ639_040827 [Escallonia herrerae]|uniref:Uncharacterized protein n=1 Tax=Escallonia herrerae TaxID=1293975 RepID=A0AA89BCM2_9ASTE|nr:hypothetical protein RJ639_040827 [Escallonia herrerae]